VIDPVPNSRNMTSDTDFVFVTREILGQKPGSPLLKAFEHSAIFDFGAIMTLNEREIDHLQYMDDSSEPTTKTDLTEGYRGLIRCFIAFVQKRFVEGDPVHVDVHNKFVKSEFDTFRAVDFSLISNRFDDFRNFR
jgi:hypothetical protein